MWSKKLFHNKFKLKPRLKHEPSERTCDLSFLFFLKTWVLLNINFNSLLSYYLNNKKFFFLFYVGRRFWVLQKHTNQRFFLLKSTSYSYIICFSHVNISYKKNLCSRINPKKIIVLKVSEGALYFTLKCLLIMVLNKFPTLRAFFVVV